MSRLPAAILAALPRIVARTVRGGPAGDCLEWTGAFAGRSTVLLGRPAIKIEQKLYYVARVVLAGRLGRPLGRGKLAAHTCDNYKCVNGAHLTEESFTANLQAAWARQRRSCRPKLLMEEPCQKSSATNAKAARSRSTLSVSEPIVQSVYRLATRASENGRRRGGSSLRHSERGISTASR